MNEDDEVGGRPRSGWGREVCKLIQNSFIEAVYGGVEVNDG